MTKKTIYHIIEWVVAVAACAYLAFRLATYNDYASLGECLRAMGWTEWGALLLCMALMPVNMVLEAWRWYSLMNEGVNELSNERMTFREAHRQVYYSKLAGLITPWHLGEYPARGLLMSQSPMTNKTLWSRVLSMGAVGSVTMTAAIVLAGLVALNLMGVMGCLGKLDHDGLALQAYLILVIAALAALLLFLALAPRLLRRWADVPRRLILLSLGQSLVRLLCWCVQLALVLWALGGPGTIGVLRSLGNCAIYYLLVTITPNVPIAEVGVRGAWAISLFGSVNAAFAGVLLWAINTLLPCLMWPFLRKNSK